MLYDKAYTQIRQAILKGKQQGKKLRISLMGISDWSRDTWEPLNDYLCPLGMVVLGQPKIMPDPYLEAMEILEMTAREQVTFYEFYDVPDRPQTEFDDPDAMRLALAIRAEFPPER